MSGAEELREVYAEVILAHWRTSTSGCDCGGMRLGQSYPHHLADQLLARAAALKGSEEET